MWFLSGSISVPVAMASSDLSIQSLSSSLLYQVVFRLLLLGSILQLMIQHLLNAESCRSGDLIV